MPKNTAPSLLSEVRKNLIELWERLAPFWGISPAAARILAYGLTRREPLTVDEMRIELAISRGAISMATRELEEWGLLNPVRRPGERRLFYELETDIERAMKAIVRTRKRREWDPLLERLDAWLSQLNGEGNPDAKALQERLAQIHGVIALTDQLASALLEARALQSIGLRTLIAVARRAGKRRQSAPPKKNQSNRRS